MSPLSRFLFALKPKSWPKLLVPLALGQALGFSATGALSVYGLLLGVGFTAFDAVFIVALNDVGDREIDRLKRRYYPDAGSAKTIPDGILTAPILLGIGVAAGVGALVVAAAGWWMGRPAAFWYGAVCLACFLAYTFPPLRLNYRGGGELLEAAGVGVLLVCFNAYLQSAELIHLEWLVLCAGYAAASLASAIASGLSDELSDRRGGKRTLVVILGNRLAVRACHTAVGLGGGIWLLMGLTFGSLPSIVAAVVLFGHFPDLLRAGKKAGSRAYPEQKRYKQHLHNAIWRAGLVAALALALGL